MWNPKVSIVIPVYNGSNYLSEAINSALAQTYKNIEIIVVNDGSNDDGATERIALSFGERIRYFSKTNGGVSTALNFGIEKMSGEYFSWLSHDDLYEKDKIYSQIEFLKGLPEHKTVLYSDYSFINDQGVFLSRITVGHLNSNRMEFELLCEQSLHGCTLLIHRDVFSVVGKFDETLKSTQDYDLWLRISRLFPFRHCVGFLIKSRVHNEQGSRSLTHLGELRDFFSREILNINAVNMKGKLPANEAKKVWVRLLCKVDELGGLDLCREHIIDQTKSTFGHSDIFLMKVYLVGYRLKMRMKMKIIKVIKFLKNPKLMKIRNMLRQRVGIGRKIAKLDFDDYFKNNLFKGTESVSGEGSSMDQTKILRERLPGILKEIEAKSLLDIPCGDWNWMKHLNLQGVEYIGADVVEDIVKRNTEKFGKDFKFLHLNLIESELPKVDAIFCRDCLVHLNFNDGIHALKNIKRSGSKYLLMTTFTRKKKNTDLLDGDVWRPLNMSMDPFHLPEPIYILNEDCSEAGGKFKDKCIGVWKIDDIRL